MFFDNELGWSHLDPTDVRVLPYLRCGSGFTWEELFRRKIAVFPDQI